MRSRRVDFVLLWVVFGFRFFRSRIRRLLEFVFRCSLALGGLELRCVFLCKLIECVCAEALLFELKSVSFGSSVSRLRIRNSGSDLSSPGAPRLQPFARWRRQLLPQARFRWANRARPPAELRDAAKSIRPATSRCHPRRWAHRSAWKALKCSFGAAGQPFSARLCSPAGVPPYFESDSPGSTKGAGA